MQVLSPGTQLSLSACGDRDFRGDWPNLAVIFESSGESSGSTIWQGEIFLLPPPETFNSGAAGERSSHPGLITFF